METILDSGMIWWITVVDIPTMTALFFLLLRNKREFDFKIIELRDLIEVRSARLMEVLTTYQLEAANKFASTAELKDLESRIVSHLLRIEAKLDDTTLKTYALEAHKKD